MPPAVEKSWRAAKSEADKLTAIAFRRITSANYGDRLRAYRVPAESSPIGSALRTDAKLFDLLAMMSEVLVGLIKLTLEAVTLGWVLRIRQLTLQDQNSLATGMNHAPMKGEVMPLPNFVCDGLTRCLIGHFHHHSRMSRDNECR